MYNAVEAFILAFFNIHHVEDRQKFLMQITELLDIGMMYIRLRSVVLLTKYHG